MTFIYDDFIIKITLKNIVIQHHLNSVRSIGTRNANIHAYGVKKYITPQSGTIIEHNIRHELKTNQFCIIMVHRQTRF